MNYSQRRYQDLRAIRLGITRAPSPQPGSVPTVAGRLSPSEESVTITCPWCSRCHIHGLPDGPPATGTTSRSSHCHPGGEYEIRFP